MFILAGAECSKLSRQSLKCKVDLPVHNKVASGFHFDHTRWLGWYLQEAIKIRRYYKYNIAMTILFSQFLSLFIYYIILDISFPSEA
jgi:hypothetical protein